MNSAIFPERFAFALVTRAKTLDWRDTESYSYVHDLNNEQLAWEFLRRCEEYRADFEVWFARWMELIKSGQDESYPHWRPVQEHMEVLCQKWSLWSIHGLGVPTSSLPPEFRDVQALRGPHPVSFSFEKTSSDISPRLEEYVPSVTIRFHLDQPIKKQLALAEKMILKLAKKNDVTPPRLERKDKRPSRQNVARYIQVLDAKLDNRALIEIAKTLYGEGKSHYDRARDHVDAALKLARSGYMEIYRSPQK